MDRLVPGGRGAAMVARIGSELRMRGIDASGQGLVREVLVRVLEGRTALPGGEEDPAFLHPARTILILMDDAALLDPVALAASSLIDRWIGFPCHLPESACGLLPSGIRAFWDLLPPGRAGETDPDRLREALERLPVPLRAGVLSSGLDRIRHLHLDVAGGPVSAGGVIEEARGVLAPMAEHTFPVLDRRFRWWLRRVAPGLASPSGGT